MAAMDAALRVERARTADLVPYANNSKQHPDWQVEQIAASIEQFGFNDPIGVWTRPDGELEIVEGHGRVMAARLLGMQTVPIIRLDHLDDEGRRAYVHVHNQTTLTSGFDLDILNDELASIQGFEWSDFGFETPAERTTHEELREEARTALAASFLVPPFSVLDTRQGYWQDRKRAWGVLIGNASETRDAQSQRAFPNLPEYMGSIHGETSNFDPVLAEAMMLWFNKPDGKVLDPFGGEQTKGIVAGELGLPYHAVEIRPEQVELNKAATAAYAGVHYYCGDSNRIDEIIPDRDFDLCFTSPPYYDLEAYSKEDMSALGTYDEFMQQYRNIFAKCYDMLADDAFLVLKVGEIRDKATGIYRSFVPDNVRTMTDIGFKYYNELILVNSVGTASMRARQGMRTRKVTKTHQNVLVFYKGDPEKCHENVLVFYKGDERNISKRYPQLNPDLIGIIMAEAE